VVGGELVALASASAARVTLGRGGEILADGTPARSPPVGAPTAIAPAEPDAAGAATRCRPG
jgi:hypothetical protein